MKINSLFLLPLLLAGCSPSSSAQGTSLLQARQGFQTKLIGQPGARQAAEQPPAGVFTAAKYPAPGGQLSAYVSPDPGDGRKHPAIVWITGGDSNTIGDVWTPAPARNDQTAAAFRKAGIVMMFPSLRGGNDNPGQKEGFLGEVDDVLAAAKYLESLPYVDPQRIYLGGHSTGGTLAMLVAEYPNRFRAVFAFGPVADVSGYGADSGLLPFNIKDEREVELRSPGYWLESVQSPTWIIEGTQGNIDSLRAMRQLPHSGNAHFVEVEGADHFSVLAPTNALLAKKILSDNAEGNSISLSAEEATQNLGR